MPMGHPWSRPAGLATAIGALCLALVAGCGSGSSDAEGDTEAPASTGDGAFPLTVETSHGDVTIPEEPERVVALTAQAAGGLVSLGVTPLAVSTDTDDFFGWFPWLEGEIEESALDPNLLGDGGTNAEAIAALDPDLIVAGSWQVEDPAVFDRLNQIAPTVGNVGSALNPDWDETLLATAEAIGRTSEAETLIAELEAEFGAIGDQVPDISGKTYQWVRADDGNFGFGNGAILELFGLIPAENQDNTQNGALLSYENTEQLDADLLLVWTPADREVLDDSPLFQNLPAVRSDTVFFADLALANALNSADPLSLHWLRDQLSPTVLKLED